MTTGLSFGNSVLAYQATIDGAGIAMAHVQMIADDIAGGRLVAAFPLVVDSGDAYHLTMRRSGAARADMVAFRSWALEEARVTAGFFARHAAATDCRTVRQAGPAMPGPPD